MVVKSLKYGFDFGDAGMILEEGEEAKDVPEEMHVVVPAMDGDLAEPADVISRTGLLGTESLYIGPGSRGCECGGGYVVGGAEISEENYIDIYIYVIVALETQKLQDPWRVGGQERETGCFNGPL